MKTQVWAGLVPGGADGHLLAMSPHGRPSVCLCPHPLSVGDSPPSDLILEVLGARSST